MITFVLLSPKATSFKWGSRQLASSARHPMSCPNTFSILKVEEKFASTRFWEAIKFSSTQF